MKVYLGRERDFAPIILPPAPVGLRAFADTHELDVRIVRCPTTGRITVGFKDCEVLTGTILAGMTGTEFSMLRALKDYALKISRQRLVIDAYKDTRRELLAPELYVEALFVSDLERVP